ncbi:MAG: hypothetical protein HDR71_04780 [Lachnospiraceae bacterium]|nr:hypothetical protein [Lachnospiraceae bacterium]
MDETNSSFYNQGMTMATVSLALGVASIFTALTVFLPLVLGGLAIIFALLSKGYGKKMIIQAKIGLACGIGGLCAIAMMFFSSILLLVSDPSIIMEKAREYDAIIEDTYGQSTEDLYGYSFEDIMEEYSNLFR